ncbi:MAG: ribosome recycling factor [Rhodothermales bacterium]|nr:ribosome recycling factor [Rhodothermales bacterium]MBO6778804.1 ribosome recycling factor [Rhodothermales bacterium]
MLDENLILVLDDAKEHMDKTLDHVVNELRTIRAGRATPSMLEGVRVDYYGSQTPLNQMANVSAPQPDLIVVQPWDKASLGEIERAIISANLGLNPNNDGSMIRLPVPPLSEERRRDLVKAVKARCEEGKVAIRNVRRHSKDMIKSTQKEENLPEDMLYEAEDRLQKLTDSYVERMDVLLGKKEEEIMEV